MKRSSSTYGGGAPKKAKTTSSQTAQAAAKAAGRVPPKRTSLVKAGIGAPFPAHKRVTFDYSNGLVAYAPGTATGKLSVAYTDLYDFDRTAGNTFGNKQPLYYDQLLSATGPYKQFKVISWTTVFTIINMSESVGLTVYGLPSLIDGSEVDILSEAEAYPGVQRLHLTPSTGSKSMGTITITGNLKDQYDSWSGDSSFIGAYNGPPGNPIYGGLFFSTGDGSTVVNVEVAVCHRAYTEVSSNDTLIS